MTEFANSQPVNLERGATTELVVMAARGTYEGLFYQPTVLADVTPEMPAYADEVFGPVARS